MLNFFALSFTFVYLLFSISAAIPPYTPTDYFLLSCGSSTPTPSLDGRKWDGDTNSKVSPANINQISFSSEPTEQNSAVPQVPYMTARIINQTFTYSFPVAPGPKFVRLYFYPSSYSSFSESSSFFSVTANQYTLLSNFSAFLTVEAIDPRVFTIVKEYVVNVDENQRLNVTISPESPSYAFINGIEIVSMPDTLYKKPGEGSRVTSIASNGFISEFEMNNNTGMENVYRLNVGGNDISAADDTGMYRMWRSDDSYLYGADVSYTPNMDIPIKYTNTTPAYVAPKVVYTTSRTMGTQVHNNDYNLSWIFPVDSGFHYLVRLHFCEFLNEVTDERQRIFIIYLNNQTAEKYMDVLHWSGGKGIPVYKDYVVNVPDRQGRRRTQQDLWLAMRPNMLSGNFLDAILNGVEIFKLNQSDGTLAAPNPDPTLKPSSPIAPPNFSKSKQSFPVLGIAAGLIGCVLAIFLIVGIFIFRRRRRGKGAGGSGNETKMSSWVPFSYTTKSTTNKTSTSSSLPSDLCRHFTISEIRSATSNFNENFVIGSGGFGNVYKGYVDDGSTCVAIKRLNPSSKQGVHEFETEIKMLSKLRHLHLVSLIGYSDDEGEMVLVYDYMANGTLRDHLYKTKNPPLSWKKRLEICIGAARGLHYLHTGAKQTIIHRDVKSTNILLDEKWVAKVSDFGLSKMGPSDVSQTHVSTVVKGSFGYVDPEYFRRQQLTEKSDVYSFGVVLLEVLCARPAVIMGVPKEQVSLAEWVKNCNRRGTLDQIMDKNLRGEIAPECLKKFVEIACSCIRDNGTERPTMGDVVWTLEFALQLQDTSERVKGDSGLGLDPVRMLYPYTPSGEFTTTDDDADMFSASGRVGSDDTLLDKTGSEGVFSEINDPKGR